MPHPVAPLPYTRTLLCLGLTLALIGNPCLTAAAQPISQQATSSHISLAEPADSGWQQDAPVATSLRPLSEPAFLIPITEPSLPWLLFLAIPLMGAMTGATLAGKEPVTGLIAGFVLTEAAVMLTWVGASLVTLGLKPQSEPPAAEPQSESRLTEPVLNWELTNF